MPNLSLKPTHKDYAVLKMQRACTKSCMRQLDTIRCHATCTQPSTYSLIHQCSHTYAHTGSMLASSSRLRRTSTPASSSGRSRPAMASWSDGSARRMPARRGVRRRRIRVTKPAGSGLLPLKRVARGREGACAGHQCVQCRGTGIRPWPIPRRNAFTGLPTAPIYLLHKVATSENNFLKCVGEARRLVLLAKMSIAVVS
jgi:hypothetical protein